MNEAIKFYKRQVYRDGNMAAISKLAAIKHPDAVDALFEIAESGIPGYIEYQMLLPELIKTGDRRAADIVLDYLRPRSSVFYLLLTYLKHLDDPRLVPELARFIEEVVKGRVLQHKSSTRLLIETFARPGGEDAIPLLQQIVLQFPFESEKAILPEKAYGIYALNALELIDHPGIRDFVKTWQARFDQHLKFHMDNDNLLREHTIFSSHDDTLLLVRPIVIDYLLQNIARIDTTLRLTIINAIAINLPVISKRNEQLYQKIMAFFVQHAQKTPYHAVRHAIVRQFTIYDEGQSIPLALQILEHNDLQLYAIRILLAQKYKAAAPRVFSIMRNMQPDAIDSIFYEYLAMVATPEAEQLLLDIAVHTEKSENTALIYQTFGKMAAHSDTAFNVLNRIVEDMPLIEKQQAIAGFGLSGKRAIGILVSLLYAAEPLRSSAVMALASPDFADAIPHLLQLLLENNVSGAEYVLASLEAIGTESAFAAINAWEAQFHD